MNRRRFNHALAVTVLGWAAWPVGAARMTAEKLTALREGWRQWLDPAQTVDVSLAPIERSKSQWREQLSSAAYDVLRKEGTERAGSHPYNEEKRDGIYACAGCQLPLFTSAMKYDSGTGWPSFFTSIPGHLGTKRDFKLIWPRTEYHCKRCGGHQGHVFEDGPQPTGQRWCNNGVALVFWPKAASPDSVG